MRLQLGHLLGLLVAQLPQLPRPPQRLPQFLYRHKPPPRFLRRLALLRKFGLIGSGPIFFGIEQQQLQGLAVIGPFPEIVLAQKFSLIAVLDRHRLPQFQHLMRAVPAVAIVVPVLEAVRVLGRFCEEEDCILREVLLNLPKLEDYC